MKTKQINVRGIPAVLWGNPSDKAYIFIHGKMGRKENAELFAGLAEKEGYQTFSFDLPEHGERTDHADRCDVWNGKRDLSTIADYAFGRWSEVSLFACSLGAWFALQAYPGRPFCRCLFQSPIVDMKWLVEHMMLWSNVTEEALKEKGEIQTPIDTLRWDYYGYIREHPVVEWRPKTFILYGAKDNLQPVESIRAFAERFHCALTVSPDSQHPFMEEKDQAIVTSWICEALQTRVA